LGADDDDETALSHGTLRFQSCQRVEPPPGPRK
jgi:hypothetical protein